LYQCTDSIRKNQVKSDQNHTANTSKVTWGYSAHQMFTFF